MLDHDEAYKLAKEAWVSDWTGGSISEVIIVCSTLITSYLLWLSMSNAGLGWVHSFWVQFFFFAFVVLLSETVLADHVTLVSVALLTASFLVSILGNKSTKTPTTDTGYKSYLTVYRGSTMLLTCIAILAVDFPIFPRRFAKVETFGTSLMDVGVGSFVFSAGIVGARAYASPVQAPLLPALLKSIRSALPLLILGVSRFILTKGVDYQEHTSEYGLHWNFFITLGCLPPFVTLASSLRRVASFSVLGFVIASAYQILLYRGLQRWILEAPRTDLISANKEGICSFMGYLSIFLLGLDSGMVVFSNTLSSSILTRRFGLQRSPAITQTAVHLTCRAAVLWFLFVVWRSVMGDNDAYNVSRRMANLPYIVWVVAFNLTLLSTLVWVEKIMHVSGRGPALLDTVNINGLVTFLWANILTGLVNLSYKTLYASTTMSVLICTVYMLAVTALPWVLWRRFQIRVKL